MTRIFASLIVALLLFPATAFAESVDFDNLVKRDGLYYKKFTDKGNQIEFKKGGDSEAVDVLFKKLNLNYDFRYYYFAEYDLDGDSKNEVIVKVPGMCGSSGLCPFYILKKYKTDWNIIGEGEAHEFAEHFISDDILNGFRVISWHEFWPDDGLVTFKCIFENKEYVCDD